MRVASRFSIAVHLLSLLGVAEESDPTSEWMAGSIGVNPVIVRNIIGMLRRAGLVRTQQGAPGAHLTRPLSKITLLDVYRAVDTDGDLFSMHSRPNLDCPVGANIQGTLEKIFNEAQDALESRLAGATMEQVVHDLQAASRC